MRGRPPVNEAASPHQTRNPRAPRSWTSGLANAPGRLAVSLPRSLGCGPASAAAAGLTVTPTPRPWTPPAQPDLSRLFLGACMRVHRTGSEKQQIDNRNDPVLTLILQMGIKAHETSVTCPVSFFQLVTGGTVASMEPSQNPCWFPVLCGASRSVLASGTRHGAGSRAAGQPVPRMRTWPNSLPLSRQAARPGA